MAKIRVKQIRDLSLENGIITVGEQTVTPLTTITNQGTGLLSNLVSNGNDIIATYRSYYDIFDQELNLAGVATNGILTNITKSGNTITVTSENISSSLTPNTLTLLSGYTQKANGKIDNINTKKLFDKHFVETDNVIHISDDFVRFGDDKQHVHTYGEKSIINYQNASDSELPTCKTVFETIKDYISVADAMEYKGVLEVTNGDVIVPPTNPELGDVYKVSTRGNFLGELVESGDMVIWNGTDWDIIQGNIDLEAFRSSLFGFVQDSTSRKYAVVTDQNGKMYVHIDPLNLTPQEHFVVNRQDTTVNDPLIQELGWGSAFTVQTRTTTSNGHVTGVETTEFKLPTAPITVEDCVFETMETTFDLPVVPHGAVTITQNGLNLRPSEYVIEGQNVTITPEIEHREGDVYLVYYTKTITDSFDLSYNDDYDI